MDLQAFRTWSRRATDWSVDYMAGLRGRPVRAPVQPGDIAARLPEAPPEFAEDFAAIMADFDKIILPGMTHWQHPRFFAYFPANASPVSMIAEQLTSTIAAQCMLWQTSPAATELETRTLDWLRQMSGLPDRFHGVIQDSASSATLCAVLTMRERALSWAGNKAGLAGNKQVRIYCSEHVHSSIDRAVWVAGIGADNLVKLPVDETLAMDCDALAAAIARDRKAGFLPAGIIACVGGTSVGASDDLAAVGQIAGNEKLFLHVDAAWAGSAMICPEFRTMIAGAELADSYVFNPHKWLGVQFDCSACFVADPDDLVRTLAISPEYLKTRGADGFINYSEWSVPLGRRFRALKLWFVLRAYGVETLRTMIRNHVAWSRELVELLRAQPGFEIVTEPVLSLFTFRYNPPGTDDPDALNLALLEAINDDGRIYLTGTVFGGAHVIRFQMGQTNAERQDMLMAFDVICEVAGKL